ncbi:MAG: ABC transporter ATP-binding protein [Sedimentisphaeraceae bacterium JB056]
MENGDTIITVKNLKAGYGEELILDDINFDVKRGEIFVILGGSGCGKSTLLKHMIGLYEPIQGSVFIDGKNIVSTFGQERTEIIKSFGVSYQNGALFGSMTVLENLRLPLEEFTDLPKDIMDMICVSRLKLVGLEDTGDLMPSELSGGMKKRVAIARAMVLEPKIIFLDEPSAGLDPISSVELDRLIKRLSKSLGITFVVVTHELESIFTIADRVIMLDKQKKGVIAEGDPSELKDNSDDPWVKKFFNRE